MNVIKNFEYTIIEITDKTFTVEDTLISEDDELITITLTLTSKQIETFFKHFYCFTCHSRQGSTIE